MTEGQQEHPQLDCPVVILCGGQGSRVADVSREVPKPLLPIGGMPILWHIMKVYSQQGFKNFILCLGHLGDRIESYFNDEGFVSQAISTDLGYRPVPRSERFEPCWTIDFVSTGEMTATGGRIDQVRHLLHSGNFMLTYGDGLARIDLQRLLQTHVAAGRAATVTGPRVNVPYGVFQVESGMATGFVEKPPFEHRINGGYFVFEQDALEYIQREDALEEQPLQRLIAARQLTVYEHDGYWHSMDTRKDFEALNEAWSQGDAPWKMW